MIIIITCDDGYVRRVLVVNNKRGNKHSITKISKWSVKVDLVDLVD